MDIIIAIIALSLLIIFHEIGHFTVAKLSKIKVHEFALFMGPKIFSFKKGETEYTLRSIPIGGMVRLEGEDISSEDENAYNNKPLWIRALVIFAGPFMNLLIAMIVFFFIFYAYGFDSTTVTNVQEGSPAYEAGIRDGDKIVKYDDKSIYTPMDFMIFTYLNNGQKTEVKFERGDQTHTASMKPRVYEKERYAFGYATMESYGKDSNVVSKQNEDGVEYQEPEDLKILSNYRQLKHNDRIVRLNETEVKSMDDIMAFSKINKDKPVRVIVEREFEIANLIVTDKIELRLTPYLNKMQKEQYDSGVDFKIERKDIVGTAKEDVVYSFALVRYVGYSMYGLVSGGFSIKDMSGPVGMVDIMSSISKETRHIGIDQFIKTFVRLFAIFSILIGATNLLPIPPLDGNKLLLIGVEAVRRKPLSQSYENAIAMAGFVFLILISIFILYNDIIKIVSGV